MKVLRGHPDEWQVDDPATAVTIGVFDGVHRGHREVFSTTRRRAAGLPIAVMTFDPHPLAVIAPDAVPRLLTTIAQKLRLFEEFGFDIAAVTAFDDRIRTLSPREFVERVLVGRLRARVVCVGADFRFGHRHGGDVSMLTVLGEELGFEAVVVPLVGDGLPVSATAIRAALSAGDVGAARAALGRAYELPGRVVPGDGRGRAIGFPTANLEPEPGMVIPAQGVYAVRVRVEDGDPLDGVANIGIRPTFGGTVETVEAHVLDRELDLYGRDVRLAFVSRIRPEKRFEGVEALVAQIERDVRAAREALSGR